MVLASAGLGRPGQEELQRSLGKGEWRPLELSLAERLSRLLEGERKRKASEVRYRTRGEE